MVNLPEPRDERSSTRRIARDGTSTNLPKRRQRGALARLPLTDRLSHRANAGRDTRVRYRRIAGTGIDVSEVGFGVWTVSAGWWGDYSDEQAVAMLRQAYDRGVTLFDTADT
ncbi:MAG: hypothetical protein FJZ92_12955 [Chloroflexi bacterium]|nr:hypothetical protein [Chloroflexota bacterium]